MAQHLVAAAAGGGARRAHDLGAEEARRPAVVQRAPHLGDQVAGQLGAQLQQRHLAHQQVRHRQGRDLHQAPHHHHDLLTDVGENLGHWRRAVEQ